MIFKPLGMTTAGFGLPGTGYEVDQPWQHGYSDPYSNDQLVVYPQEIIRNTYPEVENPAGFIYLSIKDWAKFAIQHLEGEKGGSTLLKPETFKILHTPPYGEKHGYALGWDTSYVTQYGNALDHTGATGTNFSLIWLLPDSDFGILLTTNTVSFDTSVKMYSSIVDLFSKFLPQQ
jgi:CubicO group peptidase (beta-lactamase class C family)